MKTRDYLISKYPCGDYVDSPFSSVGYWDKASQLWLIEPITEVEEHVTIEFLQVGRPGVDGIGYGYRPGLTGLWAYHPIANEFVLVAATVSELVNLWESYQS